MKRHPTPGARARCRSTVLLAGLIALSGCRTPMAPGPPPPPLDAGALVAALEHEAAARTGLRARARIGIEAPDVDVRRPQRIAVQRPDSLRVEILGLFSQVAAVLAVNDGTYALWQSGEREIERGEVTPELLWQVARVALTPGEAVDLLLGTPRLLPWATTGASRWVGARFEVDRVDGEGVRVERLRFDAEGRLRGFERLDREGALVWSATFDEHRALLGGDGALHAFAHAVRLGFPAEQAEVEVEFEDVQLDPELAPSLFELTPASRQRARVGSR